MEVYLIRHTAVAIGKDTCYGQTDVPLAASFQEEVAKIITELPKDFDAVYSSPMQRCEHLAYALGYQNAILENALLEMNFGDWEGKKWNDINYQELNNWMVDFVHVKPPNGENLKKLFERVTLFLERLRSQTHQKVLLVTHAGVIRCVWAYMLDIPLQNIFKIPVDYGQVLSINLKKEKSFDIIQRII